MPDAYLWQQGYSAAGDTVSKMKKGNVFIITGLLLIAAALILTSYNLWDNYRAGKTAEAMLGQLVPMVETDPVPTQGRIVNGSSESADGVDDGLSAEIEYPDYILNPGMDMPVKDIDGKKYIGVISIPSIDRELPVLSEWNYSNLKIGPCRYTGSAYLDDFVICAHNYKIQFGPLRRLNYGDTVTFTDMDGNVFNYKVAEIVTLQPTAIEEMINSDWDLTLFTCTMGGAARVTVRCEKVDP